MLKGGKVIAIRNNQYREKRPWYRPLEYAKRRCTDKNHRSYPFYGGRGISCELTYQEAKILFFRDQGHLLDKPSLDRIDPDKNYSFDNCRFIELEDNVKRKRKRGPNRNPEDLCVDPNQGEWEE